MGLRELGELKQTIELNWLSRSRWYVGRGKEQKWSNWAKEQGIIKTFHGSAARTLTHMFKALYHFPRREKLSSAGENWVSLMAALCSFGRPRGSWCITCQVGYSVFIEYLRRTGAAFSQAVSRIVLGTGQVGSTRNGMTRHCPLQGWGAYGVLEDRKSAVQPSAFMGTPDLGGRIKAGFSGAAVSNQASI